MDRTLYFPLEEMSDEFLKKYIWYAQEMRNLTLLKQIKQELQKRRLEE